MSADKQVESGAILIGREVRVLLERTRKPASMLQVITDGDVVGTLVPGPMPKTLPLPADAEELVLRDRLGSPRVRLDLLEGPGQFVGVDRGRLDVTLSWPDRAGGPVLALRSRGHVVERLAAAMEGPEPGSLDFDFAPGGAPYLEADGFLSAMLFCHMDLAGKQVEVAIDGLASVVCRVDRLGAVSVGVELGQGGATTGPVALSRVRLRERAGQQGD